MALISIGSDMELFAKSMVGHVSLCGKIGGSKEAPLQIPSLPIGFMIQEDNVALEFNIPVCFTKQEFRDSMAIMRKYTASILKDLKLTQSLDAAVSFDKTELTHPNALVFGCEPDYNAWSKTENQKPYSEDAGLRTCGGHVHVGTDMDMVQGVCNMDLFLGVPSVILETSPSAKERKKLYGKAGAMRPKEYGFEYRVLSNFWMFKDSLVEWVYQNTKLACKYKKNISVTEGKRIQDCINNNDKEEALAIIKEYNIPLPMGE